MAKKPAPPSPDSPLEVLRRRRPRATSVSFPLDPNDVARFEEAQAATQNARMMDILRGETSDSSEHYDQALGALREIPRITFHLESCGADVAEDLLYSHPPTEQQVARHKKAVDAERAAATDEALSIGGLQYDPQEFPPRLVAACTRRIEIDRVDGTGPEVAEDPSEDDLLSMWANPGWSTKDKTILFQACERLVSAATVISKDLVDRLGEG